MGARSLATYPPGRITGRMLIDAIVPTAEALGYRVVHFRPARTERGWVTAMQGSFSKGFPDLLLLKERLIAAEIKGDGDRLRPEQQEWLDAFAATGNSAYVWTAEQWKDGTIEQILRG